MIRCVLIADRTVILALGIVEENVRKMKAGEPLALNLGRLLTEAALSQDGTPQRDLQLMVAYGQTHREIVEEWNRQLASSGVQMPGNALHDAGRLDDRLRAEGLI